jgi:hypothetical protein
MRVRTELEEVARDSTSSRYGIIQTSGVRTAPTSAERKRAAGKTLRAGVSKQLRENARVKMVEEKRRLNERFEPMKKFVAEQHPLVEQKIKDLQRICHALKQNLYTLALFWGQTSLRTASFCVRVLCDYPYLVLITKQDDGNVSIVFTQETESSCSPQIEPNITLNPDKLEIGKQPNTIIKSDDPKIEKLTSLEKVMAAHCYGITNRFSELFLYVQAKKTLNEWIKIFNKGNFNDLLLLESVPIFDYLIESIKAPSIYEQPIFCWFSPEEKNFCFYQQDCIRYVEEIDTGVGHSLSPERAQSPFRIRDRVAGRVTVEFSYQDIRKTDISRYANQKGMPISLCDGVEISNLIFV